MKLLFARFCLLFCLFISLSGLCQDNSHYSLLWKIESDSSDAPSYLFGTMHVDDARAFNFSDAVMPAIKACENFALEIHPDSTIIAYKSRITSNTSADYLNELLTKSEYKKLKAKIKEATGKELDSLGIYDAEYLISLLTPEDDKEDDKAAFVDAYLLGQAKTMGKTINGLETVDSQVNFFDRLTKEEQREYLLEYIETDSATYTSQIDLLTDIYLTGDIYEIEKMIASYGGFDAVMESRNIVMSNSIQKLMKNGPTFSAVGAAHLPGKMGVIALLKKSGFKVTRVEANFTGVADSYEVDISKANWHRFSDENLGYSLQIPGEPYSSNVNGLDYYEYFEMVTRTSFGFYVMDLRVFNIEDYNLYIESIAENIANSMGGKIISSSKIKLEHPLQFEFLIESEKGSLIISNIYIENDIFHCLVVEDKKENMDKNYIKKFFNSIAFSEPKPLPKQEIDANNISSNVGAFEVTMPFKPQKMVREIDNPYIEGAEPYKLNMYVANNSENTRAFIFRYNDQPLGFHIANYNTAFNELEEGFKEKGKILETPKTIYLDSIEGREYKLLLQDKYPGLCRVFFRGNRTYLMLANGMTEADVLESLGNMDSFKFLPYKTAEVSSMNFDNFSIGLTGTHKKEIDSSLVSDYTKHGEIYYTSNAKTGAAYMFTYAPLREYFKVDSKADFYEDYLEGFKEWNDTVLSKKTVWLDKNIEALDFILKNKYTQVRGRTRVWLDNGHIFQYSAYSSPEDYNSSFTDSLFNSYKVTKPIELDLLSSKSAQLLANLHAKDSLVFQEAKGALYYYPFSEEDLPALYKAITETYEDDEDDYGAKSLMLSMFANLSNDSTVSVLDSVYQLSNSTTANKLEILTALQSIEDSTAVNTYTRLLLNSPPNANTYTWDTFRTLRDSVALAASEFQTLLKLNSNAVFRRDVLEISKKLLQEDAYKALVISNQDQIMQYVLDDLNGYMESEDYEYYSAIYSYLELYNNKAITNQNLDAYTERLLQVEDNQWLVRSSLETRILNHLKTDKKLVESHLDSLFSRFTIMKALKAAGNPKSINKKYLKPKEYAIMSVNHILDYEYDEAASKIEVLGEFNKNKETFYAVKLDYDYDDVKYFAVVGPIKNIDLKQDLECYQVKFNWDGDTDESLEKNWKAKGLEVLSSEDEE